MKDEARSLGKGISITLLVLFGATCIFPASCEDMSFGPQTTGGEPLWGLLTAADAASSNLSAIEAALVDASIALSGSGIDGPVAVGILSNLTMADASVIDCITIDANGTVREVQPASFEAIKGVNLKRQRHVNDTINSRLYSGFHFIMSVEGLNAIDSEMPVFDKDGTFIGTVSFMFNSSDFFERILAPYQPAGDSKIWVMTADDGTILYETDPSQQFLNKSSDVYQPYPSILELINRISSERTGYGTYEFLDQSHQETILNGCYWTTIPNMGTEIRILLTLELDPKI
ncbi:MAG TPA: hypothetical protein PLI05_06245 [Methanotrichaceae archaeon]|nr:hypothetical protein [Methanotrichaceae archaeon]HQF16651.1 hypothetical protein [Methanotrichaceae archaeon]HQI91337.1 hypothetical protein [Methanotrichaceae archaeon]HQJ29437.1 hypothetical protein [Methanotrichaceae archaeon]